MSVQVCAQLSVIFHYQIRKVCGNFVSEENKVLIWRRCSHCDPGQYYLNRIPA